MDAGSVAARQAESRSEVRGPKRKVASHDCYRKYEYCSRRKWSARIVLFYAVRAIQSTKHAQSVRHPTYLSHRIRTTALSIAVSLTIGSILPALGLHHCLDHSLPRSLCSTPHRTSDRQLHAHPSRHSTRSSIRSLPQHLIFLCIRTTLGHIPRTLYIAHQLLSIPSASISDINKFRYPTDPRKKWRHPSEIVERDTEYHWNGNGFIRTE